MLKRYILFVLFCLVSCITIAAVPDTTKIPVAWKKESVIILDYNYSYKYSYPDSYYADAKKEEKISISYYVRDKWGVEELSQISLPTNIEGAIDENNIGTVYKRDGTTQSITKDQLIPRKEKIDFNASKKGKSLSLESESSQKLAVPSLEIGDILEVHYTTSKAYPPAFITLVNKFPLLHFEADVKIIESNISYNAQSSTIIKTILMNTNEQLDEHNKIHVNISLDSVEKYKEEILNDNNRQIPYVLLKYVSSTHYSTDDYSTSPFDVKGKEFRAGLQLFLARKVYYKGDSYERGIAVQIINTLIKKHPKINDTIAYITDAFYLYRQLIAKEKLYSGLSDYEFKNDVFFSNVLSRVFFEKKIRHQVFIVQSGHYSNQATNYEEFIDPSMGIFIPAQNLYLFNPLYTYDPGNIPPYFEGQPGVSFSGNKYYKDYGAIWRKRPLLSVLLLPFTLTGFLVNQNLADKYRKFDLQEIKLPLTHDDNENRIVYEVNINDINTSDNTVSFERKTSFFGKHKLNETGKICSVSDDYQCEENPYRKMISGSIVPSRMGMNEKSKKRLNNVVESDLYVDGFDVKKLKDFKVVETNFFDKTKPFVHTLNFSAKNLAWAFNNYIILNAGNFIGEQLIVPEKSKDRQQDFYIPYQKQFVVNVTIPVPEGYSVENLNEFNVKKETPAGSFTAEAKLENNKVIIKTKKAYKFSFYMREDASDVYDFLYEAEKYYNKKLILKKL